MSEKNSLILITDEFPYGSAETFLESEFPFLDKAFNSILIIPTNNSLSLSSNNRLNDSKAIIKPFCASSIISKRIIIKYLFSKLFISEIFNIFFNYKQLPKIKVIKTMITGLFFADELSDFIKKESDIFKSNTYIYSYWSNYTALSLINLKSQNSKLKVFSRMHGWDLYFFRSEINYLPYRKHLIKFLDRIYFISENGLNYFKTKFKNIPQNKLKISKLGTVGYSNLNPYQKDIFRIVSCSTIHPIKQLHLIIEALSKIESINIEWIHFGKGYRDCDEKEFTNLCYNSLSSKKNISFKLMGQQTNNFILNYYSNTPVSLFINSSKSEGIPVSIMEAMSFGIPIIAPNVGGVSEIVNNNNGILLSSNINSKEIATAIKYFNNLDLDNICNFRKNAFITWKEKYNAELNFERFTTDLLNL